MPAEPGPGATMRRWPGRFYDEVAIGEEFVSTMTITPAHLEQGAALIADYNPLHVDDAFAGRSRFGGRILHGVITSAILGGPMGMIFQGTALGYLEHNTRFLAPVRIGDTLTLRWTILERLDKPAHGGGIVVARGRAISQDGVTVAEAIGKMLVAAAPA